jgi:acyl-CoA thioester hydrolase
MRVRYAETDQMGVAWHGNVFAWFEVGRTDLLREMGMTYRELEARDVKLPVIEASACYIQPLLYDDLIEIRTQVRRHSGARIWFDYEIYREASEGPLVTGHTAHAAIDAKGRPRRLPLELRSLLP